MHTHVGHAHAKVPEKIPSAETLNHSRCACVAPYSLHGSHSFPFFVKIHHGKGQSGDESRLEERDEVDVPVIFCTVREGGIGVGEESGGDAWCDINVQDIVEGEGREDFVGVEW